MTIAESQLEVIAASFGDKVWLPFRGQLKVAVISRGPSMTIIESQLEAIAASFGTKYGDL